MTHTPQVIFLYGPAGCGKGTQAFELLKQYPNYEYIEVGEVLRNYNTKYMEDTGELGKVAKRTNGQMGKGQAVDFIDWKYIWDHEINPKLKDGKKLLFDGVFREYHQSMFLSNTVLEMQTTSALFVIHITVDEAIKRLSTRFYVPGNRQPFSSYEEAKLISGESEPTARSDDQDPEVIRARYRNQYELQFGKCISIYQRVTGGDVYIIDGEQNVVDVHIQIEQNLANFAAKFSRITL